MAKYDEDDGVWRTIGGRRVFIRKGQNLSSAMKESGRFKSTKTNKRTTAEINKEYEELSKKMQQDDYYYDYKDDKKLKELRAEYDKEVANGQKDVNQEKYNDYYKKEHLSGPSNYKSEKNNQETKISKYSTKKDIQKKEALNTIQQIAKKIDNVDEIPTYVKWNSRGFFSQDIRLDNNDIYVNMTYNKDKTIDVEIAPNKKGLNLNNGYYINYTFNSTDKAINTLKNTIEKIRKINKIDDINKASEEFKKIKK